MTRRLFGEVILVILLLDYSIYFKGSVREKRKGAYGDNLSLLITTNLLSVASIRRKLLKTTYIEERSVPSYSESSNIGLVS